MLQVIRKSADIREWQSYHDAMSIFSEAKWHAIDMINWPDQFPYQPSVRFQVVYTSDFLVLHYDVEEDFVRANAVRHNEAVWEDSCVECFISFDAGKTYYNIEFNLLGTGLIGYGSRIRQERRRLGADIVERVSTFTHVRQMGGRKTWQMVLAIPFAILGQEGRTLSGGFAAANFYKCGDKLPVPHYLSLNPINSPVPSFHSPEYFGEIAFL
ncbi:carbohydrate-binding family 9-like protein [Sphingobacterium sp. lm-10]|uniref:carbohydrate-binding family 9-like protein n=1 Tax=Sphingobacterium sp. lm-10 TaxID=2944904 RepID=UPI0020203CD4|nr:carbohydrate-binding family 9-like protein [Sphingobacterium sp. lm-10]MCL7987511.1 carbohydrate-binding family 9-like protein [Sphingobacterium sp. lm-10]